MKADVFIDNSRIAVLERSSAIEYVMTYRPEATPDQFVSLKMPVRASAYAWHDLHPIFQMNLPEGLLLEALQERFGPSINATPFHLLTGTGRNMIGRLKVVPEGGNPGSPSSAFDVKSIIGGYNATSAFMERMKKYAAGGISGATPKFLTPEITGAFNETIATTGQYIVKGSAERLPYIALNEHLTMAVCRRAGFDAAQTYVSEDGQALLVHRFDRASDGRRLGMEDLCSLLSMKPADKYSAPWEKIIKQAKEFLPHANRVAELEKFGIILLLTYALRNADCHAKNIALLYSTRKDVRLAPIYGMATTLAYDSCAQNSPGLMLAGKRSWSPDKALERFLVQYLNISVARQKELVEKIGDAMVDTTPSVEAAARSVPGFLDIGQNMLYHWNAGLNSLRLKKVISLPALKPPMDAAGQQRHWQNML